AVAEDDRAEPVPLGLVGERALRDLLDRLREHRGDGRHDGQTHPPILHDPPARGLAEPQDARATLTRSIGAGLATATPARSEPVVASMTSTRPSNATYRRSPSAESPSPDTL